MRVSSRCSSESCFWAARSSAPARRIIILDYRCSNCGCDGLVFRMGYFGPDALVVLIAQKNRTDNERYQRDDDRECEARIDVARLRDQTRCDDRKESTEPAVAKVIRE